MGAHIIGVKWVYKEKINVDGEVEHYKAWVMVKGYKQQKEIN